jgi:hypothetical protein
MYTYLKSLPRTVEEVTLFSDCCGGQNRNVNLTTALIHASSTISNIKIINQKYLETGHTQMECDSMHAAITSAKKSTPINAPTEWDTVFLRARRRKPYTVIPMKFSSFIDFKKVASAAVRNTRTDAMRMRVHWLQIRHIQLRKGDENMYFKTVFDDQTEFRELRLQGSSTRNRRPVAIGAQELHACYSSRLPITHEKKEDLVSLCHDGIIPEIYHAWYKSLPVSSSARDTLRQADINDSSSDTD